MVERGCAHRRSATRRNVQGAVVCVVIGTCGKPSVPTRGDVVVPRISLRRGARVGDGGGVVGDRLASLPSPSIFLVVMSKSLEVTLSPSFDLPFGFVSRILPIPPRDGI